MGSFIEINDTLQLTTDQGFPKELNLETHLHTPYKLSQFKNKTFTFQKKPSIRVFQMPPVRNLLVENRDGKWIYWGLVLIIEITHNYVTKITSGKFKIIKINSPKQMKNAFDLIDTRPELNYFS